jgi:nickel-dependent lactate racemase
VDSNADVVIVSAGGSKYDFNLYNAIWALGNASEVGHRGTSYILLAECRDGLGAEGFMSLAQVESLAELRRRYMLGARAVYLLKQLTRRNEVHVVTALPSYLLDSLGVKVYRTANSALNNIYDRRRGKKTTVITHGCSTIPHVAIPEMSE